MVHSLYAALVAAVVPHLAFAQTSLSLSAEPKATNAAVSSPLDPSFAGFGIEPSNLWSFTGNAQINQFSVTLMQNLADYAGAPPHIRLGGNTQDYFVYDPDYTTFNWKDNEASTAQGEIAADSLVVGPGYFEALERFPEGTPVTVGLNMAYSNTDWEDRIVTFAQAAVDGMKNTKLYSFEIGNEPDLYLENQMRSGSWSGQVYTEEFLARADAVYNRVLAPAGITSKFFEPPATASTIGTTFEIEMLVDNGLLDDTNGNEYVSCWNQHDYYYCASSLFISLGVNAHIFLVIGVTPTPIVLNDLLDLDSTNTQFAYWEKQVSIALKTGLPYVLREMSSVGPIGMAGISDTHGAALWTLNFFLYMATLDVSSVQMHMTDNSNASAWQPREMYGRNTFVRPQYYAHVAMAQIIGNGNGTTQIAGIKLDTVDSSYTGHLRAYTAYANGNIQSLILINTKEANASETNKASFTYEMNLGSDNGGKDIFISYLTADGADSLEGTTFNGMTFSNDDGKMSMEDDTVHSLRTDSSGKVSIPVRDSQAVVANLNWALGSNAVLTSNGEGVGGRKSSASARPTSSGASTAALTGVVTTTLAFASSIVGGDVAQETGVHNQTGAVGARGIRWRTLLVCLTAVMIGFIWVA
jgi:hypothetical protein